MQRLLIRNIKTLVSCDEQDTVYENVDLYAENGIIRAIGPKLEKPASFEPVLDRAADDEGTRVIPSTRKEPVRPAEPEDYEEDEPNDTRDSVAETLIRWVPPLTAIVCAAIALWGFVYYQFMM